MDDGWGGFAHAETDLEGASRPYGERAARVCVECVVSKVCRVVHSGRLQSLPFIGHSLIVSFVPFRCTHFDPFLRLEHRYRANNLHLVQIVSCQKMKPGRKHKVG